MHALTCLSRGGDDQEIHSISSNSSAFNIVLAELRNSILVWAGSVYMNLTACYRRSRTERPRNPRRSV